MGLKVISVSWLEITAAHFRLDGGDGDVSIPGLYDTMAFRFPDSGPEGMGG